MLLLAVVLSTIMFIVYSIVTRDLPYTPIEVVPYAGIQVMLIALSYYLDTVIANQEKILCLLEKLP